VRQYIDYSAPPLISQILDINSISELNVETQAKFIPLFLRSSTRSSRATIVFFRNRLIIPDFDGKIKLSINELIGPFFMHIAMELKMRRSSIADDMAREK
jgi:hypothetical protein